MAQRRQAATNVVTGDSGTNVGMERSWAGVPEDLERYQLMPEEAFFLAHGLGCLKVKDEAGVRCSLHIMRRKVSSS